MAAATTGNFRRFERFSLLLCFGSLLLVPVFVAAHPPMGEVARDLVLPQLPATDKVSDVLLLIIAIVGTTVAPWQLFFQQSYVIDKRIPPRFMAYEKADLWIGIALVIIGAVAMVGFCAATFAGRPEFGNFTDAGGIAAGLAKYVGSVPATLFAVALIDASIIGASAVSLATAYALGDVLSVEHSLHRSATDARGFYLVYAGLIAAAATLVLIPGVPLGLITQGVQTLAGVLLPSATVFLLLLCNDQAVLGPWVNGRLTNLFTGAVIAVLVLLSIILTASVLYPDLSGQTIVTILAVGAVLALIVSGTTMVFRRRADDAEPTVARSLRPTWRMPPLSQLVPSRITGATRIWMIVLRGYLVVAVGMVLFRLIQLGLA